MFYLKFDNLPNPPPIIVQRSFHLWWLKAAGVWSSFVKDGFYTELYEELLRREIPKAELSRLKNKLCKKYGLPKTPTDIDVLLHAPPDILPKIRAALRTKPTRTMSGVAPIAAMTKPFSCPHGVCTYCPGGPKSKFNSPQSYTGHEPSAMRGARNDYDPYLIVFNRLEQYVATGNVPDKVELIIQGGTFPAMGDYQEDFMRYAFKAMNDFGERFFPKGELDILSFKEFFDLPGDIEDEARAKRVRMRELALKGTCDLSAEHRRNESAKIRCVALCIETKPDWCMEEHITEMLRLGTTRVEVGVQSLRDEVLHATHRGHGMAETYRCSQLLKDSFLKVTYHMMPGLPGSTHESDVQMFSELFSDVRLRPDALKIYPCLVMPGTALEAAWKQGRFHPIDTKEAASIISEALQYIPGYCRVMRVQRDIPTHITSAGVDKTNLRQYVDESASKDIRAREIGHVWKTKQLRPDGVEITTTFYDSSGGEEAFIEAKDITQDILIGFCRLRRPHKPFRPEITPGSVGIRELHVYGDALPIADATAAVPTSANDAILSVQKTRVDTQVGKTALPSAHHVPLSGQHKGWGEKLLMEAERIARERYSATKMLVIAGVGARKYYERFGYARDGAYMSKAL